MAAKAAMEGRFSPGDFRPLFFIPCRTMMVTSIMPRQVRVLKRTKAKAPVIVPIKVVPQLNDRELKRDRENVVNDWIDERRRNELAENLYSQAAIVAWREDRSETD